jgi:tetratricopeptide (TPR) repeat protein
MNPKAIGAFIALMVVGSVAYAFLAITRAWVLLSSGDAVQIVLALSIVVIPIMGVALIARELLFGWSTRAMGRQLAAEGGLPQYHGRLSPSGRPTKEDADAAFAQYSKAVQADPDQWRVWFRLAMAYEDARDRKRARAAMRRAAALFTSSGR